MQAYDANVSEAEQKEQHLKRLNGRLETLEKEEADCTARLQKGLADFQRESTSSSYARVLHKQIQFIIILIDQKSSDLKVDMKERNSVIATLKSQLQFLEVQIEALTKMSELELRQVEEQMRIEIWELATKSNVILPSNFQRLSKAELMSFRELIPKRCLQHPQASEAQKKRRCTDDS